MFLKVYQYYIQIDKEQEYLSIQKRASKVYQKYVDVQTVYFRSSTEPAKWMEISKYRDEKEYLQAIKLINKDQEIKRLYNEFQAVLDPERSIVGEESYYEMFVL